MQNDIKCRKMTHVEHLKMTQKTQNDEKITQKDINDTKRPE